jgi:hypothetical protein
MAYTARRTYGRKPGGEYTRRCLCSQRRIAGSILENGKDFGYRSEVAFGHNAYQGGDWDEKAVSKSF